MFSGNLTNVFVEKFRMFRMFSGNLTNVFVEKFRMFRMFSGNLMNVFVEKSRILLKQKHYQEGSLTAIARASISKIRQLLAAKNGFGHQLLC